MNIVAKCSASVILSYQVHVKVCNPISLRITVSVVQVLRFFRYRLYLLTKINQMVKSLLTVKCLIIIH